MKDLISVEQTMSSRVLLDVINLARIESGEPEVRLNKFNEKIEDELEGDHYTFSVVQNLNNTESKIYQLTADQCMLLTMRECKEVRGDGHRKNVWQWRETTNVIDNLIKAKAGLGLTR